MSTMPHAPEQPTVIEGVPLRIGSREDFARVKSMFESAGFDESTVCRVLGIDKISAIGSATLAEHTKTDANANLLILLIRLFLLLESIERGEVERCIGPSDLDSMLALDLIRLSVLREDQSEPLHFSPVLLAPISGLLVASDRYNNPDGSPFDPPADVVFPSIYAGTLRFLRVIPKSPVADVLDIGAGSGIGALAASRYAGRSVAVDITSRAVHFVTFNARLNELGNMDVVQGDVYSGVEDRMFGRIIAHPPYVPSMSTAQIYRDAGQTGEALLQRIIGGLPKHLRPGGTFASVCAGWDTKENPFEERARAWLGESASEFDLIFAFSGEKPPAQVARQLAERSPDKDPSLEERWNRIFSEMERLVYGALIISRRPSDGRFGHSPMVMRTRLGSSTDGADFEWFLNWRRWRSRLDWQEVLAAARPMLGPSLSVKVTHVVDSGALVPANFMLESEKPFPAATNVDPWIASLLKEFVGELTAAEVYQHAKDNQTMPEQMGFSDFMDLVSLMIERGYLQIDDGTIRG
jgi:SAM-dependent methyltransferase